jgi:Fe-S oxidoreductase
MTRLLSSYLLLALRLLRHLATRLLPRREGERLLLERYAGDGLAPYASPDQEMARVLAGCDGCGLCDSACALRGKLPLFAPGPTYLVLSLSRALPHLDLSRSDLSAYEVCSECGICSAWCPRQIPIERVPGWARGRLARLPEPVGRS